MRDRKDRYIVKEKEEREMLKMKISKIHMKGQDSQLSYEKDLGPFFHIEKTEREGVEDGKREKERQVVRDKEREVVSDKEREK